MKFKRLIDSPERQIIDRLNEAGYSGFFVGGCVRDVLMGREFGDIDITTGARPEETEHVFADCKVIQTGLAHGTVTVIYMNRSVEITTFRRESEYSDMRHPDKVSFVKDVTEDLARRDFTMNAIAMDSDGNLTDPFGGASDIEKRIIRAVGNPQARFEEDALRIMRGIRFAAQLGFDIDETTEEAMYECSDNLRNISAERIYVEFKKLVIGEYAGRAIRKYVDILGVVIPYIKALDGFSQHNPNHKYDVLGHCIRCMQNLRVTDSNREYMRLAALFHDIGKPETFALDDKGIGHCFGHPEVSAEHVEEILRGLKADSFTINRVVTLVRYHDLLFKEDEVLLKKWLNKFGPELLYEILELKRADNLAIGCDVTRLIAMFDRVKLMIDKIIDEGQCFRIGDLKVNGNDIMKCCNVTGVHVGRILNELLLQVMGSKVANEKAPLLEEAMRIKQRILSE
ncbi:MAG: CCA tRNA nucleotidyltransferase [Bacillota bacterium]|nr:CCA tRNA nucleotidyltransferase [Bacillota bacterium]